MKRILLLACVLALLSAACTRQRTVQKTETIMGTLVTLTVVAADAAQGEAVIEDGMAELRRLDAMMSHYKEDSELSRVNRAAGTGPVKVSPEMIEVVEAAQEVSRLTDGAFDVTIGPLVVLWQKRLKEGSVPTEESIARALPLVNYRNVAVDRSASTMLLKKPGMILDLGGCAKGYAADRVAALLRNRGITNAVIAVAGDIWVLGKRENGSPWRIGIQHPRESDRVITVLDLSDRYVSTSGDYERFVIRGNKRYHHIIDPRTGRPAQGTIAVTVVGDRGATIDPLTTALFILGPAKGRDLVRQIGAEALFVNEEGMVLHTDGIHLSQ